MLEYIIQEEFNQVRIDKWLRYKFANLPQSFIEKSLRSGKIKSQFGKVKSSHRLITGEKIFIYIDIPNKEINNISPSFHHQKDYDLLNHSIIFENNHYLVLNKPRGFCVQNGTNVKKSIIDIMNSFREEDLRIVHRIDKDTTGILILAKDLTYARYFTKLFREHLIKKTYLALCHGFFKENQGTLRNKIEKSDKKMIEAEKGKECITEYRVLKAFKNFSLVELKPLTGRMHQLRTQLSLINHSIVGDKIYGKDNEKELKLHAFQIEFPDINGKICKYEAPHNITS